MDTLAPHYTENPPIDNPACMLPASILNSRQNLLFTIKPSDTITPAQTHKRETPDSKIYMMHLSDYNTYPIRLRNKLTNQGIYPEVN